MLKGLVVNEVMSITPNLPITYDEFGAREYPYVVNEAALAALDPNDTYMLIFSPNNFNALKCFKEQFKGKILFEGRKAINTVHPGFPRNTIVIFEVDTNETQSQV